MKRKNELKRYPVKTACEDTLSRLPEDVPWKCAVSAEIFTGDEKILVLHVYERSELEQGIRTPCYRIFQTKTDFITWNFRKEKWMTCSWPYLLSGSLSWRYYKQWEDPIFWDKETEKTVEEYFGIQTDAKKPLELIYSIQEQIIDEKRNQKKKRQQERIDKKMKEIAPAEENFRRWVMDEALHWSRFIFYNYSRRKHMQGWCTECKQEVSLKQGEAKHNRKGICPLCKKPVTFIASGRKPSYMYHWASTARLEKIGDQVLYREFFAAKHYRSWQPSAWKRFFKETKRIFFHAEGKVEIYRNNNYGLGDSWHKSRAHKHQPVILYPENLREVLQHTRFQYCALPEYCERHKREYLYPAGHLQVYERFPGLEYFVKRRLDKMVLEITEQPHLTAEMKQGKDLKTVLDITSMQELELARSNLTNLSGFWNVKKFLNAGVKLSNQELLNCFELYGVDMQLLEDNTVLPLRMLTSYIAKQVERHTEYPGYPLTKDSSHLNWREKVAHCDMLLNWRDYVSLMKGLSYEIRGEAVLCPADLLKEHNRVFQEHEKMKKKKEQARQRKEDRILKKLLVAEQERLNGKIKNKKFQLVVPCSGADIRREGRVLGHCVSSYTASILAGKCQIYFIRKVDALDSPYYTVEYKEGKIIQCRGKKNCGYNKEMRAFLKTAERQISKRKEQSVKAA